MNLMSRDEGPRCTRQFEQRIVMARDERPYESIAREALITGRQDLVTYAYMLIVRVCS